METYENGIYKIQKKDFKKIGKWDYCFVKGNEIPDAMGLAIDDYKERLEKENPSPLPFIILNTDYLSAQAGSNKGRIWVSIRGNIHTSFLIPRHIAKSARQYNFFPMLTPFAIRDVLNEYVPGNFACKFPNDVICREHECKVAGNFSVATAMFFRTCFGLNLIAAPPEHLLRSQGLKACCLKNHVSDLPTHEEILIKIGDRILELNDQIAGDADKFLSIFNDAFIPYVNKRFKIVLNNPNADVEKDGVLWCPDLPDALYKGFLNDELFNSNDWGKKDQFWERGRFKVNDKNDPEYKDVYQKIKEYEDSVNKN